MQKARRHILRCSDRLQAYGFRNYFTPLLGVLFTFPSQYSFAIGLTGVFSLTGWSRWIPTRFHVPRCTQDTNRLHLDFVYWPITIQGEAFQLLQLSICIPHYGPTTPPQRWFGLFPVRSPLLRESLIYFLFLQVLRCFNSLGCSIKEYLLI